MPQIPTQPNLTPRYLYNPTKDDFTVKWDDVAHTIHSEELKAFPAYLADHIAHHLAKHIVGTRGIKTNYEDDFKAVMEEIIVNINEQ